MITAPARGRRPSRLDVFLSLSVTAAGLVESYGRRGGSPGEIGSPHLFAAGTLAAGALLLVRNRFPITALLVLIAVGEAVVQLSPGTAYYAAWHLYSMLILAHTIAAAYDLRSRHGIAGLGCVIGAYIFLQTLEITDVPEMLITAIFLGVAYGSGILLRRQTAQTTRLAALTARLEAEREERARRAVAEERARIARDLHDVISHNVSVMTLHAGGVRMMLGEEATRERELLQVVEQAGREAVGELALMLGMLREVEDSEGSRPGLDRLGDLVAQMEESGVDVTLTIAGSRRAVPSDVDLAAYRVVQESLTNVLKHAGASRVELTVTYAPGQVTVELTDDGAGPATAGHAGGFGQIGMRERVTLHGGTLTTGAAPGGGYRVLACFPSATAAG
ncbi:sensor histidine kinase [Nonomuraea soli]|uniref:histidine kinase n=1 Tax=Nonomuraea soli TaxID=1032476 RepID=A0A7W0CK48_9ACTN|nr:histidine kinase [Nonomuraea soli]MBA2892656.1 signal transduction histidine kinase [Nonomuraea soli]